MATNAPPTSMSFSSPVSACFDADLGDLAVVARHELERHVRRHELDVVLAASPLLHDLRRAELVAPVDDLQVLGELRDEDRVLHRRVAAADHGDVLVLEEGAVADSAGGDAAAAELHLAGDAEPLGLRPHGEDHGPGAVDVLADLDGVDVAVGQLDLGGVVGDEAGAEALGLGPELVHHLRPHDALGIARVVLDVGRVLELAAPLEALDDQRLELGAGGIERRRVAGGPAADDDQVFDLVVHASSIPEAIGVPGVLTSLFIVAPEPSALRPSRSQRLTVLRSWKKATMPGGIGSQKAITR